MRRKQSSNHRAVGRRRKAKATWEVMGWDKEVGDGVYRVVLGKMTEEKASEKFHMEEGMKEL